MSEKQNKEVPVEQQMAEQAVESATNAPAAEPQAPASDLSVQDLQGLKLSSMLQVLEVHLNQMKWFKLVNFIINWSRS